MSYKSYEDMIGPDLTDAEIRAEEILYLLHKGYMQDWMGLKVFVQIDKYDQVYVTWKPRVKSTTIDAQGLALGRLLTSPDESVRKLWADLIVTGEDLTALRVLNNALTDSDLALLAKMNRDDAEREVGE